MKIFRFLSDVLTVDEFYDLSYHHVSMFITKILRLAFEKDKFTEGRKASELISLR